MADPREAILVRLLAIFAGVIGVDRAVRNAPIDDAPDTVIGLYDGSEQGWEDDHKINRPPHAPFRTAMRPVVMVHLGGKPEDIGTAANAIRAEIIKAVLTDATLAGLVGSNGAIWYIGADMNLSRGEEVYDDRRMSFQFLYPIVPAQL